MEDLSAFGSFLVRKAYSKKKKTSLVHAQIHDLAKLWLHKNTQTVNAKKELHRIYTSELLQGAKPKAFMDFGSPYIKTHLGRHLRH